MEYPNITIFFTEHSKGFAYLFVTDPMFRDMLFDLYCSIESISPEDPEVQKIKESVLEHCFLIIDNALSHFDTPLLIEKTKTMPIENRLRLFVEIFRAWVQFESDKGADYLTEIVNSHNIVFRPSADSHKVFEFVLVPNESPTNTKH